MIHVTCRLTAKNRDQLRDPTRGNRLCMGYLNLSTHQTHNSCEYSIYPQYCVRVASAVSVVRSGRGGSVPRSAPVLLPRLAVRARRDRLPRGEHGADAVHAAGVADLRTPGALRHADTLLRRRSVGRSACLSVGRSLASPLPTRALASTPPGMPGTPPPNILVGGDVNGNIPPILLRTFGYNRPLLVALRSLSLKPISFGYKTPPIRFSQAGGQSAHEARPSQP